jgi:hypothetical protein
MFIKASGIKIKLIFKQRPFKENSPTLNKTIIKFIITLTLNYFYIFFSFFFKIL